MFDPLNISEAFGSVCFRVTDPGLHLQVLESIVPFVVILVVNQVSVRNQLSRVRPPHKMVLVHVLSSILEARVILWRFDQLVRSVLHGSGIYAT